MEMYFADFVYNVFRMERHETESCKTKHIIKSNYVFRKKIYDHKTEVHGAPSWFFENDAYSFTNEQ